MAEPCSREPLGPATPHDSPRTAAIKANLYLVTGIPIQACLDQMEADESAGSNNRSGFRGVRQVSVAFTPPFVFGYSND